MADSTFTYDELLQENAALKAQLAERDACRERNRRAEEQARLSERLRRVAAESALRESEARYRTLADTMPQVVFIATASGFVEYVNRPGLEYMGMRLDEAIGFGWLGAIHPDDRRLVSERWLECLTLGKTYEFEHRLLCANGQYRWQQARAVPIGGESGAIVRWIGTSIDIHDRRQVERDLEEVRTEAERHAEELDRLYQTSPAGLAFIDSALRFVRINRTLADINGFPVESYIGRTLRDMLPPALTERLEPVLRRVVTEGEAAMNVEMEGEAPGNPGRLRYWLANYYPLKRRDGTVLGVNAVVQDITQRRLAEEALRRNEELLRLVTDSSPIGMIYCDDQRLLRFVNRAYVDPLGLAPEEVIGKPLAEVIGENAYDSIRSYVDAALSGIRSDFEAAVPYERIGTRFMRCAYVPHLDERGLPIGFTAVKLDITDRRRMEEALRESEERLEARVAERTQELTQLHARLRALSTELNLIEQRERKRLATDLHDYLAQLLALVCMKLGHIKRLTAPAAHAEVAQTESIVNEALIYTRTLVAQLCPPVLHEFGLPLALRWLAEQMIRQELSVEVQQRVSDHLPLPEDQAVLLFQSVRELLINVRKHAKTHHAVMLVEQLDTELCITVRDEGAGADVAVTNATSPPSISSSKFGLFSIRERMLAIGGRLELESATGQGMTARLIVPLVHPLICDETAGQADDGNRIGDRTSTREGGRIRVLLVDDHPMIREGLRGLLYVYDDLAVVGEACNGEEALSLTDKLRPDCVIMDVNMPRMDGIEATRRLKAAFINTAVIGLSVNASREVEVAMRRAGVDGFLSKEAPVEAIYRTILETARTPG